MSNYGWKSMTSMAFALALLAGCGGKPDWVRKGSGAFKKDEKVFYGVGVAENIQSEALRRTTADNRAIAEISKVCRVPATTSSPWAFTRKSPCSPGSPVEGSRLITTPVPDVSPMLPNTIVTMFTAVPRSWGMPEAFR